MTVRQGPSLGYPGDFSLVSLGTVGCCRNPLLRLEGKRARPERAHASGNFSARTVFAQQTFPQRWEGSRVQLHRPSRSDSPSINTPGLQHEEQRIFPTLCHDLSVCSTWGSYWARVMHSDVTRGGNM